MPVTSHTDDWVIQFRARVNKATGGSPDKRTGWRVSESKGRVRLKAPCGSRVMLNYPWTDCDHDDCIARIKQIYKRYVEGDQVLATAALLADTSSSKQKVDLAPLIAQWRLTKLNTSKSVWEKDHLPALARAAELFASNDPPRDGRDLCLRALQPWIHTSSRLTRLQRSLRGFLEYSVRRGELKPAYLPGEPLVARKAKKKVGYPLSDPQILRLLESLPTDQLKGSGYKARDAEAARQWKFAIQLMSVYGLRPEDLNWLTVKDGPDGPELWSMYQKSQGGNKGDRTEPRKLEPLLVRDIDGTPIDWNLLGRFRLGEKLPPLGPTGLGRTMVDENGDALEGQAGERVKNYLRRRPMWKQLITEGKAVGETCTPYSFRHRYIKESYARGLEKHDICRAAGHTTEVHDQSYTRFQKSGTSEAYAKANEGAVMAV